MSLNKFTDISIKPYLNIGCDSVYCDELKINGVNVQGKEIYDGQLTITCNLGNISNIEARWYYEQNYLNVNLKGVIVTTNTTETLLLVITIPNGKTSTLNSNFPASIIAAENGPVSFISSTAQVDAVDNTKLNITLNTVTPMMPNTLYINGKFRLNVN